MKLKRLGLSSTLVIFTPKQAAPPSFMLCDHGQISPLWTLHFVPCVTGVLKTYSA
jgi:hypothetical protein